MTPLFIIYVAEAFWRTTSTIANLSHKDYHVHFEFHVPNLTKIRLGWSRLINLIYKTSCDCSPSQAEALACCFSMFFGRGEPV